MGGHLAGTCRRDLGTVGRRTAAVDGDAVDAPVVMPALWMALAIMLIWAAASYHPLLLLMLSGLLEPLTRRVSKR